MKIPHALVQILSGSGCGGVDSAVRKKMSLCLHLHCEAHI